MVPVPINKEGEIEAAINYFDGDLGSFLVTAKSIGATAVFVQDFTLEDWLFFYDPNEDEEESDSEDGEIDLAAISPALAKYKKYLGKNYAFHLAAKGGPDELCFKLDQDWVSDFENEIERAQGKALVMQSGK